LSAQVERIQREIDHILDREYRREFICKDGHYSSKNNLAHPEGLSFEDWKNERIHKKKMNLEPGALGADRGSE